MSINMDNFNQCNKHANVIKEMIQDSAFLEILKSWRDMTPRAIIALEIGDFQLPKGASFTDVELYQ